LRRCRKRDRKRCRGGKHRHDDQHALPVPEHSEPSICICCGIDDTRRRYGPYPPEQGGARMPAQSDPYATDGSITSVPQEDPMKAKPAILALVMSAMLGFPASAQIPATGEGIGGIYAGSYLCEDGEHGVVLDIAVSEIEERTELRVNGTLGIVPVLAGANGEFADVAGSFTISGF